MPTALPRVAVCPLIRPLCSIAHDRSRRHCPGADSASAEWVARRRRNGGFPRLFRFGTTHAHSPAQAVSCGSGRMEMAKFEALAFAVGFIVTGFLSFAA